MEALLEFWSGLFLAMLEPPRLVVAIDPEAMD